ncbi:protein kinase family protein [Paenibacillus sp. KQZ6P-2]|uniref:Protein kinase family protein n=1 Tax=Paenibacillus mangrovi TaxID=2931978 RepID=A0A9X1WSH9_9BACL|nr:protein kinase family protein [Paenibacillus mangrovi]MCJ8013886.1 protein kinase family protein [Paenibacillus mangrovi]
MWKQYTVDMDFIGKGSYGKVYKAYDPKGNKLAIKQISDIKVAKREAKIMKKYKKYKFLIRYYDFFIIDDMAYLVTEFADGKVIGDNFHNSYIKPVDEKKSVEIAINILKGAKRLHKVGYIHNDIKPKNVMIKNFSPKTVKIIDFNIAKKIVGIETMHKELQDVCRMCAFLIHGNLPNISQAEFNNKKLKSVLLNPFEESKNNRYKSADELIHELKQFC